jgi:4,5-DOPA dioxygenase extradiol
MAKLPAIFFGHGNPMNAIQQNEYTKAWRKIGQTTERPKAILSISAHWYIQETSVLTSPKPRTIHDFGGFPRELYKVQYPAPGSPELARLVQEILSPVNVVPSESWGLDHGTWSVLCHVFPDADIPVVQLSIDETQPAAFHYELGKRLAPLRDQDVLIMGSGNMVHNLHTYAWGQHNPEPYDWAVRFEKQARKFLQSDEFQPLIDYELLGHDALLSIPTLDHYLPLLYVIGTKSQNDSVSFPVEGVDGGSVSMLTVQIG